MNLKYLPQAERLLSGTLPSYISSSETDIEMSNPPSASKLPTYIEIEPDSDSKRELVRAVKVNGSIVTVERSVNGVVTDHAANSAYKQKITSRHWGSIVDAIEDGYITEDAKRTLTRSSSTEFTIDGYGASDDLTSLYSVGRILRFNGSDSNLAIVSTTSYNAGTNKTTITVTDGTVPTPLTSVEIGIMPSGAATKLVYKDVAQTLTNKTLTSPTINSGTLTTPGTDVVTFDDQGSSPANPSAGYYKLYFKTDGKLYKLDSSGTETEIGASSSGGTAFWSTVPGTPTRVSDTQFTITDTSNANLYDKLFKKGVLLKWMESTTFQTAMVISSSYATNAVTVNIVGDSLTAGFTDMKYAIPDLSTITKTLPIAGTFPSAATTNISFTWTTKTPVYILSADLNVTAGSGTGSTVVDINVSGTTKFTTKPTITTTGTSDLDNVADSPSTEVAAESAITIDVDSVTSTAPSDGYVTIFYYPSSWRYRE